MFIYSNHYSIISKLTNEDFKHFFTNEPLDDFFSEIDENEYHVQDFIDVSINEFESTNFVIVDIDPEKRDETIYEVENFLSQNKGRFAEYRENERKEEHDRPEHYHYYKDDLFITDQVWSIANSEPFFQIDLTRPFALVYVKKKVLNELTGEMMDNPDFRMSITFLVTNYKEEDFDKGFVFPNDEGFSYDLNESYNFIKDNYEHPWATFPSFCIPPHDEEKNAILNKWIEDNFGTQWGPQEQIEDGSVNHIWTQIWALDDDATEFWFEPLFVFGKIREMHYFKSEKDFFKKRYTCPQSDFWFDTRLNDNDVDRFTTN